MARTGGRPRAELDDQNNGGSEVFVRALARGLTILAMFDVEHPEWSLNEICQKTGISKTTAYRMLRTMESKGFLAFDRGTERYHLGRSTIPSAYLALSYIGFARATRPFLEELARATGESVELTVEGVDGAIVVDHVATTRPFKPNLPTGRVLRNLTNSAMKMHVAHRSDLEKERALKSSQPKLTPYTVTDRAELAEQLAKILDEGVSFDLEEQDVGVCAVSAPVLGSGGDVMAVVTLVLPPERFGPRDRPSKIEAVKSTAAELTRYLSRTNADQMAGPG